MANFNVFNKMLAFGNSVDSGYGIFRGTTSRKVLMQWGKGRRRADRNNVDEGSFISIATFLPVRSWGYVIPFLVMSFRVERQAKKTPGLVKYALKADFPWRRFWTLTVWNNRDSVRAF